MRLPEHLFKFWVHRLKSKKFVKIKNQLCDGGAGRCAAGVLLPEIINKYAWYLLDVQEPQAAKLAFVKVRARVISVEHVHTIANLNDNTVLSFKAIARILKRNQHNNSFIIRNDQLNALEELYKYAVENGEYVEST